MAEVAKVAARQLPGFKLGRKQVFLPNHVIVFLRREHLPPNEACFQVPLTFTKFDLRDYLWNLYDVEVKKVRSYVQESPIVRRSGENSYYRPMAKKIMTVELAQPFQWPSPPADLTPWNKDMFEQRQDVIEANREKTKVEQSMSRQLKSKMPLSESRKTLMKLANQLRTGQTEWSNGVSLDPKWESIMAEVEKTPKEQKKAPVKTTVAAANTDEASAKGVTR